MAERHEVYKCDLCGNIVQVLVGGGGELVCCGESMKKLTENTVDAAKEKHVPAIEKVDGGYKVKVGSVAHPMEEKHWIQWIEHWRFKLDQSRIEWDDKILGPLSIDAASVSAREHCNLHGLWKA